MLLQAFTVTVGPGQSIDFERLLLPLGRSGKVD
jgi:hypothetical protein